MTRNPLIGFTDATLSRMADAGDGPAIAEIVRRQDLAGLIRDSFRRIETIRQDYNIIREAVVRRFGRTGLPAWEGDESNRQQIVGGVRRLGF